MIAEYISRTAGDPFIWGENDCALWCASLVHDVTGTDPAKDIRGTYDSFMTCRRLVMDRGGLARVVRDIMSGHAALDGGDGVCIAKHNNQLICGIITGEMLAMKTRHGIHFVTDFEVIEGWKV